MISIFNLQIIEHDKYRITAENNFLRIKTIYPVRGEIYDQNYQPIVTNKPSYNIYISPGKIIDREKVTEFLSKTFALPRDEIQKVIYENRFRLFQEILILQNVNYDKLVKAAENFNYFPSLNYKAEAVRKYHYKNHFTGHLGRINTQEYDKLRENGYSINSFLGKNGLEKNYETLLRGENGYEIIQVDASGKNLQFFKNNLEKKATNGADLILTIDNRLQDHISKIFPKDRKGAVVLMNPRNGVILAYVSKPDFDQNIFSSNISNQEWNALINDPDNPLLDRVIHGTYPPGSVYKPIIASLGLEKKLIDAKTKLANCTGGLQVGNRFFKCWYEQGHGRLNVIDAMKYSCDVFFYDLSTKLTLDEIKVYTRQNMMTIKTGIDLTGERAGFFPDKKWYVDNYGRYISIEGQKVNLAIGQGEILVTPLQICAYYAALCNGGLWVEPHLFARSITEKRTTRFDQRKKKLPISAENFAIIEKSLFKVVNEAYGTGVAASISEATVYGKTGSAENHMGTETHAWFAGFVRSQRPDLAFVVFLENAGHGGSVAAPLARKIIRFYLSL